MGKNGAATAAPGKRKRKSYTDDFRADCVLMLEAAGYPTKEGALTAVSNKVGVPARTISRWFNKEQNTPPDQLVNEKKGLLVNQLEDLAYKLVDVMGGAVDDAPLRELATAFGIVVDKWQLLSNKPTAIVKLEQAIRDGRITPEQVREKYPTIADQYFANVDR